MPDLLVNLLKLDPVDGLLAELRAAHGVVVRRANPWEVSRVREFAERHWSTAWADEASVGFARQPVTVLVAVRDGEVVGFCAYECTRRDFLGPMGVAESERGRGVGKALLLASLWGLREMGYVYAIIGGAGPVDFYAKTCGATVIPDSAPGIYTDMLKRRAKPQP